MKLAALRSAVDIENPAALFAQETDNRIQQRKNKRISRRFRQRQMKIQIRFDVGFGSCKLRSITATASRMVPSSWSSIREAAKPAISGSSTSRNSAKFADPSCWLIRIIRSSDCRMACEVPFVTKVPRPE